MPRPRSPAHRQTCYRRWLDKSLLRWDPAGRYDMHELVRQYAGQKLRAAGEQEQVRLAHLDYIVQLAESTEPHLIGGQQAIWLDRLEVEYDNIRAALDWSLEQRRDEQAARLAGALWRFWGVRGYLGEGRGWLERLLAPGRQSLDGYARQGAQRDRHAGLEPGRLHAGG